MVRTRSSHPARRTLPLPVPAAAASSSARRCDPQGREHGEIDLPREEIRRHARNPLAPVRLPPPRSRRAHTSHKARGKILLSPSGAYSILTTALILRLLYVSPLTTSAQKVLYCT